MINKEIICIANIHSVYRSYIKLLTESWTLIKTHWEFAGQIISISECNQNQNWRKGTFYKSLYSSFKDLWNYKTIWTFWQISEFKITFSSLKKFLDIFKLKSELMCNRKNYKIEQN